MDFRRAWEDGYKDGVGDLSQTDKAFMAGIAKTYGDIETFLANADDVYDEVPEGEVEVISKAKKEFRTKVLNDLRDYIRTEWYETVIVLLDDCPEDKKRENEDYDTPEPLSEEDLEFDVED